MKIDGIEGGGGCMCFLCNLCLVLFSLYTLQSACFFMIPRRDGQPFVAISNERQNLHIMRYLRNKNTRSTEDHEMD